MGQLSKTFFGDVRLLGRRKTQLFHLAPLFSPRAFRTPPVYVNEAGNFKGLKFYYHSQPTEDERQPPVEVIPAGRVLEGEVDFENLTAAELGLLFFALGIDGAIVLKLGGGKPLGLGSVRAIKAELRLLASDHYTMAEIKETIYSGETLAKFIDQATDSALESELLLSEQALALAEILAYDEGRPAPEGAY
jgi:hypothetical protein